MSKFSRFAALCVAAVCGFVSLAARATSQWTCGSWMAGFTAAENNIVRGLVPTGVGNSGYLLTDGQAEVGANKSGVNTVEVGNGKTLTFTFDSPMIVREVRVYATWADDGRDSISVSSVQVSTLASTDPQTISPSAVSYDGSGGQDANYAYLADDGGVALAKAVTSLTVNFGNQENGYVGYPEIEVVGEVDRETPTLLVVGDPTDGGTVEPGYGINVFFEGMVSACSVWTNAEGSVAYRCAGWKLYRLEADGSYVFDPSAPNATGTGRSFDYVLPDSGNCWKLVWQWAPTYHVAVSSTAGGTAAVEGETDYFAPGETATVTAVPTAEGGPVVWTGDQPFGLNPTNRTVSFAVTGPTAIKANFEGATWVSDSDELNAALDAQAALIVVNSGDYQLTAERDITSDMVIQGATGNPADATIAAASGKRRTFQLNHADARLRGLTLKGTGGTANGVVYIDKGFLENCRVTGGCVGRNSGWGAGVCNNGGTVRRCTIDGNTAGGNIFNGLGLCQKAGLTEYCFITNNTYSSWHGAAMHPCPAGAYVSGGTLRGSLIAHNTPGKPTESTDASVEGFALHLAGRATVDVCAIVGNTVDYTVGTLPTAAVYLEKVNGVVPTIVNSIVVDNRDKTGTDLALAGEREATASLLPSSNGVTGNGNVFETANTYTWTPEGEFSLEARSAAVDSAQPLLGGDYVLDLYGRARVVGAAMDMGPAELEASSVDPAVTIRTDSTQVYAPATSVFTANVIGFPTDALTYGWTIDGEAAGSGAALSADWTLPGVYTVGVTVTGGGVSKSDSIEIAVLSKDIYLDASCTTSVYPYATPETAATNWSQVVPLIASGGSITIRPGTYSVDAEIALQMPYRLQGDGPRDAIVLKRSGSGRLISITHKDATANGITFSGGSSGQGGTMYVSNGACVENCNLFDGECGRDQSGGGCLWVGGATVRNCVIGNTRKGSVTGQGPIWYGLGVRLEADGLVENCLITNVVGIGMHRSAGHAQGCAVHMVGGTLRNCLVAYNQCTDGMEGEDRVFSAGVYQKGGRIEYCTITANEAGSGPAGCYRVGGTMVNTIVWGNVNNDAAGEYDDVNVAGAAAQGMDRCLTSDPRFKAPQRGDFRLKGSSPAVNAGSWALVGETKDEVRAMRDLLGCPRLLGSEIDLGCYECQVSGLMLIVQ